MVGWDSSNLCPNEVLPDFFFLMETASLDLFLDLKEYKRLNLQNYNSSKMANPFITLA